ncbi:MAG: aminotransferase class I/II-fold pyridoxal phosphate-dependent enzyme [Chloroflexi bacterium]|nr:aminotransferase class I/II-fold pyridoxal phosphate-dependent enzyme [Chloroflexota bacterium]
MNTFAPHSLLNPHLSGLEEYTPIQPFEVLSKRLGIPASQIVKLDANENPYGPLPAVAEALAEYPYYHIYPDPQQSDLREALSGFVGVPAEHILPGQGADELLDYICRLFLSPGDAILNAPPTFGMYSFDAKLEGAQVIDVWRRADYSVDVEEIERRTANGEQQLATSDWGLGDDLRSLIANRQSPIAKLLFLTSPNNPSGTWLPDDDLRRLLALPLLVVLDEAYVEFANQPSRAGWVLAHDNLIVLRTFSKAAGIAGLRLGYGIVPAWLMPHLWKFKQPYNVNVAASVAGLASLHHTDQIMAVVGKLKTERDRLFAALSAISYLRPYPSEANFVLCRVEGQDAAALKQSLERQGILVRYYNKPGLDNCIRISVGRPEQTDRLLEALRRM